MYTLDCNYYQKEFRTVDELLTDVLESGTDPNSEILRNGQPTGETAWDLIEPGAYRTFPEKSSPSPKRLGFFC